MEEADRHRSLILDQFTKQAVPFTQLHARDDAAIHQLLIETAGISSADHVLDVACGPGLVACEVARIASHVTGIDLTPAMIEQARERQQKLGLTNLSWKIGSALPLPYPDASFSSVITRYSFHHFTDPGAVFAELMRVCRSGGRVTVADVFTRSHEQATAYDQLEKWRDPSHTHALRLDEFRDLFSGLPDVRQAFYKYPVKVEELLARSFPDPGGAEAFRSAVRVDIDIDRLGISAAYDGKELRFEFPVTIVSGVKP
jgi:ubiquinone/menaquinone biosynthesis C-methylase UbiE